MDVLLTSIPWSYLGPGTVLFVAVLAIIRGDLVPRRHHEEIVGIYKADAEREREVASEALEALTTVKEYGATVDRVIRALPHEGGIEGGEHGAP